MFTKTARELIAKAKAIAAHNRQDKLDTDALVCAIGADPHALLMLAEAMTDGDWQALSTGIEKPGPYFPHSSDLPLSAAMARLLETARSLASTRGVPDRQDPGYIDLSHLVLAVAMDKSICHGVFETAPLDRQAAIAALTAWYHREPGKASVSSLVSDLRSLRDELKASIFGQDHAIHTFIEGLYNMSVTTAPDDERGRPRGVFVFAGPPGVGKTYLTEIASRFLQRPFRRFDMTAYADHNTVNQLIGVARSYKGAEPGLLTGFVKEHPHALLLFDEVEKAHLRIVQLFYQILDAGRLQDNFTQEDVSFRHCIIIFTTNAGRSLYDNPNASGIHAANTSFHRQTILSALKNEKNPSDGRPAFPPPICSRLGQGYPILFNHLGVNELEKIADSSLRKTARHLALEYRKLFFHDPEVPMALIYREGGAADARQISANAERFYKTELLGFCNLYEAENLTEAFTHVDRVRIRVEMPPEDTADDIRSLFHANRKPKILFVCDRDIAGLYRDTVSEVQWLFAATWEETSALVAVEDPDLVLLDIWMGATPAAEKSATGRPDPMENLQLTVDQPIDHVPLSARRLKTGREILVNLHERFARLPVYLLSMLPDDSAPAPSYDDGMPPEESCAPTRSVTIDLTRRMPENRRAVDDALFLACTRAGGARGVVATRFAGRIDTDWMLDRNELAENLMDLCARIQREKRALTLARERKAVGFDTAGFLDREKRELSITLRNFRFTRVIEAGDAGRMVDDIHRPEIRFADVIGATAAKEALGFIVKWLADPRKYSALGLRRPRGVLMAGPPGTGKTMLARALAGESRCAFVEKAASAFVSKWVGSGPESVRDLFDRARRYAPTIVFIDELDTIGTKRTGHDTGGTKAYEETLNALLTEMDGFGTTDAEPVIVLAATNLAERLDPALRRRFDRVITVDRPDRDARAQYLTQALLNRKSSQITAEAVQRLAIRATGMTIADLQNVVQQAGVTAAQAGSELTDGILEEAFERIRMGEARKIPPPEILKRTAYHEAGHALIAHMGGNLPIQVTIIGRGDAGGYMEREIQEDTGGYTKPQLEQLICEAMGGRAAEIVVYGEQDGQATGISGDLRHATTLARKMAAEFAMTDTIGYAYLDDRLLRDGAVAVRLLETTEKIVRAQLERAVSILTDRRSRLERLSAVLLEKNRLSREEICAVLDD